MDYLTARVGELSDNDIFYWLAAKMLPLNDVNSLYLMRRVASQW